MSPRKICPFIEFKKSEPLSLADNAARAISNRIHTRPRYSNESYETVIVKASKELVCTLPKDLDPSQLVTISQTLAQQIGHEALETGIQVAYSNSYQESEVVAL